MFPQTHIHFARTVLEELSDFSALGSIFPDMITGAGITHKRAHSAGRILINNCIKEIPFLDFTKGVITHGIDPPGLDYYGDEYMPGGEKGYAFEKGRPLVDSTIRACNIPEKMGWWKTHNIIEMGVELYACNFGAYGDIIREACSNDEAIEYLGSTLPSIICPDTSFLKSRINRFPYYIEVYKVTPLALARKFKIQMYTRHGVQIDTEEVARLISTASEMIYDDIEDFFALVKRKMQPYLNALQTSCEIPTTML